jgi:hypothetical protein
MVQGGLANEVAALLSAWGIPYKGRKPALTPERAKDLLERVRFRGEASVAGP